MSDNNKIGSYYNYLNSIKRAKNALRLNEYCVNNKICVITSADFSEVLRYCYPASDFRGIETGVWESKEKLIIREKLTLDKLFNKFGKILILPPHVLELKNNFKHKIDNILKAENIEFLKAFKVKLEEDSYFQSIIKIIVESKERKFLFTREEKNKFNKFIKEKFGELKFLTSFENLIALKKYEHLKKTKSIITLDEYLNNLENERGISIEIDYDKIYSDSVIWFEEFLKTKMYSHEEKESKQLDAIACSFISFLNGEFINRKSNTFLTFVSRSTKMLNILDDYGKTFYNNEIFVPSRNLEAINVISNTFNGNIINEEFYRTFSKSTNALLQIRENYNYHRFIQLPPNKTEEILQSIENIYNYIIGIDNIGLFLNEKDANIKPNNDNKDAFTILTSLLHIDNSIEIELLESLKDIKLFEKLVSSLNTELLSVPTELNVDKIIYFQEQNESIIEFHGVKGEMGSKIAISNPKIKDFAIKHFNLGSNDKTSAKLSKIDIKKYPEMGLIYAYNYASEERYQLAINTLKSVRRNKYSSKKVGDDAVYMLLQIYRKLAMVRIGLKLCISHCNEERHPRLMREFGVLIWLAHKYGTQFLNKIKNDYERSIKRVFNIDISIRSSIFLTEECLNKTMDKDLILRCLNSLTYYYLELDDLNKADETVQVLLERLEQIQDKNMIPPRFYDTLGYVLLKRSEKISNNEEKIKKLEAALNEFRKAYNEKNILLYEDDMIKEHIFATKIQIWALKGIFHV
jgi:hypothetical protein